MKFPLSWLKRYLDTAATADELALAMTRVGLEVEDVSNPADALKPFVIARVLTAERHPQADKLQVLNVDTGNGDGLQVVCGAPNARAGLLGVAAGVLILALMPLVDRAMPPMLNPPAAAGAGSSAFNGFLASFYGGIAEELQLRLFLMTLLVWGVARLRGATPPPWVYWAAIVVAALLFGAGHLPAAAKLWGLDTVVVLRTLLLNGIAGVVFGWLYWKRGLEMAMLSHFSADIVLHVIAPLLSPGASP